MATNRAISDVRFKIRDMGTYLKFNGTNSKIAITSVATQNDLTAFSFVGWVVLNGAGGGSAGRIFHKGGNAVGYLDIQYNGSKIVFSADWDTDQVTTLEATPNQGRSFHFVLTYSGIVGEAPIMYVDSVSSSISSSSTSAGSRGSDNTDMAIGNRTLDTARSFDGSLDDVKIYNKVLSQDEIENDYYRGITATGLVGYWKLDETSGSTAIDSSGYADGTISNATYATSMLSFSGSRSIAKANFIKMQSVSNATGGATSLVINLSAPSVANRLIVVNIKTGIGSTSATVTDNASTPNTYAKAVGPINNGSFKMYQFYGVQVTGGATQITVTLNASDSMRVQVEEFSGNALTNALVYDTSTSKSGTGTSGAVDAFSPQGTGELIVAGYGFATAGTPVAGTNYVLGSSNTNGTSQYRLSSTTSETAPMSWTNSVAWTAVVGAYKPFIGRQVAISRQSI